MSTPMLMQNEGDIGIKVITDPNIQLSPAYKFVLDRSPYFTKLQDNESPITLPPDIPPKIFEIIYNYYYTKQLELSKLKTPEIIEILNAASKLGFQEVIDYLQEFLVEKKSYWMEKQFILIHQISFGNNFFKLQEFCNDLIKGQPELIFQLSDFNEITEEMLISLIERDDLLLEESVIWRHVLKWGLKRNSDLPEDPKTWSDEQVNNLKNTLKRCLPSIRFSHLNSKQFYEEAHNYIARFDDSLHDQLLKFYLVPGTRNFYPPRKAEINGSEIINKPQAFSQIFAHLSKVINNEMIYRDFEYNQRYSSYSSYNNPYELKLLLRGSRHGFTPKIFHELCDNKPGTVTIIKVKGKDEILGGYNPGEWVSKNGYGSCKSFIFSLKGNFEKISISHVDYSERALNYGINYGPSFGLSDLIISGQNFKYSGRCCCKMDDYKQHIRNTENNFSIEEYEVFQVIKNNN